MKRARFVEQRIIEVLKEHEAGAKAVDLARKRGVSERPCTTGKLGMAGWTSPRRAVEAASRKRTRN
jgi:putative transposase